MNTRLRKTIGVGLSALGWIWTIAFILAILVACVWKFHTAPTLWKGFSDVLWLFSPFNIINWVTMIVCAAPGMVMAVVGHNLKTGAD